VLRLTVLLGLNALKLFVIQVQQINLYRTAGAIFIQIKDSPGKEIYAYLKAVAKKRKYGTMKVRMAGKLVFPSVSEAEAEMVCSPESSITSDVQLQSSLGSTTALHSMVSPSMTVTVIPGSAVPVKVGQLRSASSEKPSSSGVTITGAWGGGVLELKPIPRMVNV
jgi:hypothetical protein